MAESLYFTTYLENRILDSGRRGGGGVGAFIKRLKYLNEHYVNEEGREGVRVVQVPNVV